MRFMYAVLFYLFRIVLGYLNPDMNSYIGLGRSRHDGSL